MTKHHLQDQRGMGMLFEIILVGAVLSLVGFAVYQASHRAGSVASQTKTAAPTTTVGIAASAAAVAEQSTATDANLSTAAESAADSVTDTDTDVTNLGSSYDASSF